MQQDCRFVSNEENLATNIKSDLLRWLVTRSTNCAKAEEDLIDHHGQDMRTRLYSRLLKVTLAAADLTNCQM